MSLKQPKIPDFKKEASDSSAEGKNYTPLKLPKKLSGLKGSKKKIIATLTVLIAIIIPVASYYVYTQRQTTESSAAGGLCHNGPPPSGYITEPKCYAYNLSNSETQRILQAKLGPQLDTIIATAQENGQYKEIGGRAFLLAEPVYQNSRGRQEILARTLPFPLLNDPEANGNVRLQAAWAASWGFCSAPRSQMCKKKTITQYECQPGGFVGPCGSPTPTPPPSSSCTPPEVCVDLATAKTMGCPVTNTKGCALSSAAVDGVCCASRTPTATPTPPVECPPPNACVPLEGGQVAEDVCQEGTLDKLGTQACATGGNPAVCCLPKEPTPTPSPTVTPTGTLTPTPEETVTPTITQSCELPVIDVQVECLECGERVITE